MEFEGAGIFRGDGIDFGRGADSNEAKVALFLRSDIFAGCEKTTEWFGVIEGADVTDGEAGGIEDHAELGKLRHMEIKRETVHSVFLAIEIAHAPAGDVDGSRGAQNSREGAAKQRTEETVAVGADPGAEGVVVDSEMNFFAL